MIVEPACNDCSYTIQQVNHISISGINSFLSCFNRFYKPVTKFRLTLEPLTRGLFYAAVIGIAVSYQLSVISLIALGLFLLRWIIQTAIINISARRMGLKRFGMLSVLWFDISLPLVNLWMILVPKKYKWK